MAQQDRPDSRTLQHPSANNDQRDLSAEDRQRAQIEAGQRSQAGSTYGDWRASPRYGQQDEIGDYYTEGNEPFRRGGGYGGARQDGLYNTGNRPGPGLEARQQRSRGHGSAEGGGFWSRDDAQWRDSPGHHEDWGHSSRLRPEHREDDFGHNGGGYGEATAEHRGPEHVADYGERQGRGAGYGVRPGGRGPAFGGGQRGMQGGNQSGNQSGQQGGQQGGYQGYGGPGSYGDRGPRRGASDARGRPTAMPPGWTGDDHAPWPGDRHAGGWQQPQPYPGAAQGGAADRGRYADPYDRDRDPGPGQPTGYRAGAGGHEQPHFDPEYHQWRTEQMRQLDEDYKAWREQRYQRFSDEFGSWRKSRSAGALPAAAVAGEEDPGAAGDQQPGRPAGDADARSASAAGNASLERGIAGRTSAGIAGGTSGVSGVSGLPGSSTQSTATDQGTADNDQSAAKR